MSYSPDQQKHIPELTLPEQQASAVLASCITHRLVTVVHNYYGMNSPAISETSPVTMQHVFEDFVATTEVVSPQHLDGAVLAIQMNTIEWPERRYAASAHFMLRLCQPAAPRTEADSIVNRIYITENPNGFVRYEKELGMYLPLTEEQLQRLQMAVTEGQLQRPSEPIIGSTPIV